MQQGTTESSEFDSLVDQLLQPEKKSKELPNEMMGELSELMNGLLQPVTPMAENPQEAPALSSWAAPIDALPQSPVTTQMPANTAFEDSSIRPMPDAPELFEGNAPQDAFVTTDLADDLPIQPQEQTEQRTATPQTNVATFEEQPDPAQAPILQAADTQPHWDAWQSPTDPQPTDPLQALSPELSASWTAADLAQDVPEPIPMGSMQVPDLSEPRNAAQPQTSFSAVEIPDLLSDVQVEKAAVLPQNGFEQSTEDNAFASLTQTDVPEQPEPTLADKQTVDLTQVVEGARELTPVDWIGTTDAQAEPVEAQTAQSVRTQTLDALADRLSEKPDAFSIRLTPEGLGEITVHLTHTADGLISLAMTAANPKTAACLNQELGALQEALMPHHAEITQITTAATPDAGSQLLQQQFGQAPGQDPHNQPKPAQTFSSWGEYAEDDTMTQATTAQNQSALTSRLDTYI